MATATGGKRVFPPEWYAAQAARRKQRAAKEGRTINSSKGEAPAAKTKRKYGKIEGVHYEDGRKEGGYGHIHFERNAGGVTKHSIYDINRVSSHSVERLKRVLAARKASQQGKTSIRKSNGKEYGHWSKTGKKYYGLSDNLIERYLKQRKGD